MTMYSDWDCERIANWNKYRFPLNRMTKQIRKIEEEIGDVWEDGENRVGVKTRYKRYFIVKTPNCAVRPKKEEKKKKGIIGRYIEKLTFWKK